MFSSSEDESEGSSFSRIVVWNTLMSQEMIFLRLVSGNDTELVKKTNRRATTKSFFEIGSDFSEELSQLSWEPHVHTPPRQGSQNNGASSHVATALA